MAIDGFGSFNNAMTANATKGAPKPEVGMGATELWYTDRTPMTIVKVSPSGQTVWAQEDKATRTDNLGMTDSGQTYTFERDPTAPIKAFRLNKRGQYRAANRGNVLRIGERQKYHDYSF